ncbi:MAG: MFS transporter [Candidatus Latescibacteria bacterium]|nr:MFS transporter [Candidatus Latescibacterota bacterium]
MAERRPNALERFLGLFSEVRGGEGAIVLLLTLNVFLLLSSYYIVKPVREALILAGGGAEIKSYAAAGQGLLLLVAVPIYARLASFLPRRRLINVVTLFFTACLAVFYMLAQVDVPLGIVFFLWVGIFNLMVIAQFWSFANDVYSPEAGKRLFPIIAFGASAGAVLGSYIAELLIGPLGVYQLMLAAGGLLLVSLLITGLVDKQEQQGSGEEGAGDEAEEEPIGSEGAFKLVLENKYLLLIALLMLLLNWVNTTGEYILGRTVQQAAAEAVAAGQAGGLSEGEYIGRFYASFFKVVNLVGLVVQLFLVSRIIKVVGIRVGLLILPVIALGGYLILAFVPILAVVRWAKTAENATDYSLQNTVRQALFLPTTREQKYKAKQAIDTFFVRAGDVMSAVLVYIGVNWLAFNTQQFALVNLALVVVWLFLALKIGRGYNALTADRQGD